MAKIHPTSVVMSGAQIADDVEIGPMCFVGEHVKLGSGCKLIAQCNIDGYTTIGKNNTFHPFVAIGQPAQDHSIKPGEIHCLEIGDNNLFREGCTVHTGTVDTTRIGNDNMFMNATHVAHDCQVGNHVIMVGFSGLAGHCHLKDGALMSAFCGMHQFCRVGRLAILSGGSVFSQDIPPFMMAEGRNGGVKMINLVGLKRAGFSEEKISIIKSLFRIYYRSGLIPSNALAEIERSLPPVPEVREFIEFCHSSKRGVIPARIAGKRA